MTINLTFLKFHKITSLLVATSILFYTSFAYDLVRTDYIKLVGLYLGLFFLFYKIVEVAKNNIKFLTYVAFVFRAVFLLAIPNLSQDFYRFLWDGRIILEGINPYLFTVDSFISNGEFPVDQAQELYEGMGALNASHFSNYPPLNQLCFVIAGLFTSKSILGSVVVMRLLIIAADFGILHFGKKLLENLKIPAYHIFWYILNPFIIIELTGNLHYEGVMLFFLIWSLYLLHKRKWQWSAVVFALSVSVKLIPLIFLPLLYKWFMTKKGASVQLGGAKLINYYNIVGFTTLILFAPFYSQEFITNYTETVKLWFQNFEFNASIYYIAREIGFWIYGYNQIAFLGKFFALCTILFVLRLSLVKKQKGFKDLFVVMLFGLSFYYFTSTTVHPWYIATLLLLSVFTNYKFPLVWSLVIILSYLAYLNINKADKSENLWIITLEYLIVYGVLIWEIIFKKKHVTSSSYLT
ncbi:mannosyltransferase [Flavobacteriaceae sp. LMIT009]